MPYLYTAWVLAVTGGVIYALLQQERFRKFMDDQTTNNAEVDAELSKLEADDIATAQAIKAQGDLITELRAQIDAGSAINVTSLLTRLEGIHGVLSGSLPPVA